MPEIEEIIKEIQQCFGTQTQKITIVVGTGSSMSVDLDFGMGSLEKHLKTCIPSLISDDPIKQKEWNKVLGKLEERVDFENSLNVISSEGELLSIIIKETGNFVCRINRKYMPSLQEGKTHIPISALFEKLSKGKFSRQNPTIDVITPNYDLLLEYAFVNAKYNFTDGFYGNVQKEFDWKEAENDFERSCIIKNKKDNKRNYHFRLHKVHGSLNYFNIGGKVVRDDTLAFFDTDSIERFIITPGTTKYERIVDKREFYAECDKAIENTDCFIFVGYGFNDNDIDSKIRKQLEKPEKNAIIITKNILMKGKELISTNKNIIAIEENDKEEGSIIHYQNGIHKHLKDIWKIDTFVKEIL
jgi:hypothetical protein